MSYLDKQYIAPSGHDFTPYVHTPEDVEKFEKMSELEMQCIGVPAKECINQVVESLNLGRELQGIEHKVIYIGQQNPELN